MPHIETLQCQIKICEETLVLLPQKAILWEAKNTLIISDLHLGKVSHFRKEGIQVPYIALDENYNILNQLLNQYKPQRLIFLGDLFHSIYNREWEQFCAWRAQYTDIQIVLVKGNHDILAHKHYLECNMVIIDEMLADAPFAFSHEPGTYPGHYNIAGHIHPSVVIRGKGRQNVKLPCFHFTDHQGLLPSFGAFTGNATVHPLAEDKVFVVLKNKVMTIQ